MSGITKKTDKPKKKDLLPAKEIAPDMKLVEAAVAEIRTIWTEQIGKAIERVGEYLLKTFYDGNIELARHSKRVRGKTFEAIGSQFISTGEQSPSQSWLYNSINLMVDKHDLQDFHSYGKLSISHKVLITHINKLDEKKEMAKRVEEENLSVADLRILINESRDVDDVSIPRLIKQPDRILTVDLDKYFNKDKLGEIPKSQLIKFQDSVQKEIDDIKKEQEKQKQILDKYAEVNKKIDSAVKNHKPKPKGRPKKK